MAGGHKEGAETGYLLSCQLRKVSEEDTEVVLGASEACLCATLPTQLPASAAG